MTQQLNEFIYDNAVLAGTNGPLISQIFRNRVWRISAFGFQSHGAEGRTASGHMHERLHSQPHHPTICRLIY